MAEDEILMLTEAAYYLKLTGRSLYRSTRECRPPGFKIGSSHRFRLRDIEAWIDVQKAEIRREGGRG